MAEASAEPTGIARSELILGGQRSGKSRRAETLSEQWLAQSAGHEAVFIATAAAGDPDMGQRIARHQQDRAERLPRMQTLEEPLHLAEAIRAHSQPQRLLVIDCLTLWLTNRLMPLTPSPELEDIDSATETLAQAVQQAPGPVILVSNEIGLGVIPMGREVRGFVDALGRLNQRLAQACARVTLMSAGLPLTLKTSTAFSLPREPHNTMNSHAFPPESIEAVYQAIHERRDMRHFCGGSVAPDTLRRLLDAAHHAPSVGFMQPWRFIRITQPELREQMHQLVEQERLVTAQALGQRQQEFMRLKVQGLSEAAEVLAVVLCDGREQHVFGRRTLPQMDLASAACAIQNLWLAARAEGLGMGWVSLFEPDALGKLLKLPPGAQTIALLCLGPVETFYAEPMLQQTGWAQRQPLASLVYDDAWRQESALFPPEPMTPSLELPAIPDIDDADLAARLRHKLDNKTKPVGALGRIEDLGLRLGLIQGREVPVLQAPQMLVCAGDHGLAAQGVSAYPSDVTWQMVENFLAGGAAVSVIARQHGLSLTVMDCGVRHDFTPRAGLLRRKVAPGTADSSQGPAMSAAQCAQAIANGMDAVKNLPGNVLLLGEMGIGNTSAASLLLARLAGLPVAQCTGAGTGLAGDGLARKIAVLEQVLARHPQVQEPLEVLAAFGGFEIASLVGATLQAAAQRRVIVVDGFIVSAAVLVAARLAPHVLQRCVFAHRSNEQAHGLMLAQLGNPDPLLDLGLRLGEGSGAAMAWPLLQTACRVLGEMASFESAGVSEKSA